MPTQKSKTFKIITGSALALALVVAGGTSVSAAVSTTGKTDHMSSLVTAIATKFNLNTTDVQAVFDTNRTQMEAQMKTERAAKEAERLSTAVSSGKLTQAQADLIKAKQAELEAAREAKRSTESTLTDAERKAAMDAERTSLQAWMTANSIPQEYMIMGGGHGRGGPRNGGTPSTQSTTTQ